MSAAAPPTVPPPAPDDDAPEPRTPLRRWLLAAAISVPVAATYGLVVLLVARALFLDDAAAATLRDHLDGAAPNLLLWAFAAAAALSGAVFVAREVLDHRAARREGREPLIPVDGAPRWVWPLVGAGSPIVALLVAGLFTWSFTALANPEPGEPAVIFVIMASVSVTFVAGIGVLHIALPSRSRRPDAAPDLAGIEESWLQQAAARCYWDALTLLGIACLVSAILPDLDLSWVLIGVLFVAIVDFPVRLLLLKRREERA